MEQQAAEPPTDRYVQERNKLDSTKEECEDDEEEEEFEYVPPDGGWGWLVLGGSVLVSLLIPGTIKSFGILFVEFSEVFNASPSAASWIPAITYFLYSSLGPLASYLSTKYSYRTVTLLGGMFAAAGMISSVFATEIAHLYICYGILVGTGAGLSFPPGVFIVTSYFVRLRGLANGIAISGSALGSIILPPFLRFLLDTYGFRGAVLIIGGLILNVLVGASLYDPVEEHLKRVPVDKKKNLKQNGLCDDTATADKQINGDIKKLPEEKALLDKIVFKVQEVPLEKDEILLGYHSPSLNAEIIDINQPLILEESIKKAVENGGSRGLARQISNSESVYQISRKISTGSYRGRIAGSTSQISRHASGSRPIHRVASANTMTRKISVASNLSSSSFRYISTPFHGSTLVGLNPEFSSQLTMKTPKDSKSSCFSNLLSCFTKKSKPDSKGSLNESKENVYRTLLKDPIFIIIVISNASTAIGYTNFTILIPSYAVSLGFSKDKASYLISIISIFDLTGRIGGSALSDWLPISKKYYYIGGLLFSGISLVMLTFHHSYTYLVFFCGAFGLSSGINVGITAIIIADLLGEERLASSYGISLFVNGVLQFIGPVVCGYVFQAVNSYNPIIATLGLILICGASGWMYLPFTKKKKSEKTIMA